MTADPTSNLRITWLGFFFWTKSQDQKQRTAGIDVFKEL